MSQAKKKVKKKLIIWNVKGCTENYICESLRLNLEQDLCQRPHVLHSV